MEKLNTEVYIKSHISRVKRHILLFIRLLLKRAETHDASKLEPYEFSLWKKMDEEPFYPYGSPEYNDKLKRNKPVFDLHYKRNRHHPEHYENGYMDMTLIDMIEMLCDWLGYKENISHHEAEAIVEQQMKKYHFSEDIQVLLLNTLHRYFAVFHDLLDGKDDIPDGVAEELKEEHTKNILLTDNKSVKIIRYEKKGELINLYV